MDIDDLIKNKPRLLIMTKYDLCDKNETNKFIKYYEELGYQAIAPYSGTIVDLLTGEVVKETLGIAVKHAKEKAKTRKAAGVYARLLAAGQRLMTVIRHNEGGANKDLAKFADQINAMCDKWDR